MFKGKPFVLLIIVSIITFIAAGCSDDSTSTGRNVNNTDYVASETFEYSVVVDQHTRLSLNAINGSISITGIPGIGSVTISGEKKVGSESLEDAQEYLQFLEVIVEDQITNVEIHTEQPDNSHGRSFIVDYVIRVPDNFIVNVNAVNGLITIGAINNNLNLQNANGQILLGNIYGSVAATLANGQIGGDITLPLNGLISLSVANGDIHLTIPDNTSAYFSGSVANGIITVSNLFLQGEESSATHVTGTLGDGSGNINLSVANGTIDVTGY
jgi:hypothetical protein